METKPKKITEENVRDNLKRYREAASKSQLDIALGSELSQGQISHLERGKRRLKVEQLIRAAEAIGISSVELLQSNSYSEDEIKLVLDFHKLMQDPNRSETLRHIKILIESNLSKK